MPRAPRVCAEPGCPKPAAVDGRCEQHRRPAWARSANQTTRTNKAWRNAVLKQDGYICRNCGQPATEADHIVPRSVAPNLEHDPANGQALCKDCHTRKTKAEAGHRAARQPEK